MQSQYNAPEKDMAKTEESLSEELPRGVIARGIAVSGFGNFILYFINFSTAIIILRWLTLYEYGVYRLILAVYDFAAGFYLGGLENVVISDASANFKKNTRESKSIVSVYVLFVAFVSLILISIFFFFTKLTGSWLGEGAKFIYVFFILFAMEPITALYRISFQIFLDFNWKALNKILRDVLRLATLGIFFMTGSVGIRGALWGWVVSVCAPILLNIIFYQGKNLFTIPSIKEIKSVLKILFLKHGAWAMFDDFLQNVGKNIRPFVIKFFVGIEAVSLFSAAQSLVSYTTSIFPIREVLIPVFPRYLDRPIHLTANINRAMKYSILIYSFIAIISAIFAPILSYLFFPKYIPSMPLFYILLLGVPVTGLRSVILPALYSLKAQRVLFNLTALRTVSVIVFGIVLTYFFGIWGATIEATLIGYIITAPFIKSLQSLIPQWKFSLRNIFQFDSYDRLFAIKIKDRITGMVKKCF